jgi:hypothetical protein
MPVGGKIEFGADKVSISGPSVDGGFKITFSTGEYEQLKIAELLTIPQQTALRITVEIDDGRIERPITTGEESSG